eukprot:TRINITY_DN3899_c0_g1_i2.p5 TRINITY_DN3899_c0_g1~~TRINITY_DN3899_c0_g1_i2.p5  ORF type:complete len:59 (+),score=1.81 TRINITY_DN3899_c0_g1_i2:260-436(+)
MEGLTGKCTVIIFFPNGPSQPHHGAQMLRMQDEARPQQSTLSFRQCFLNSPLDQCKNN